MSTKLNLSKITRIALRDCWDYEDRDFTPWLAQEENIAILADALGIPELEVKAKEEHVGPFRADILCAIPGTDKLVLIENQLEKTDHNHLGQIMTYAAGLDAVTIIWIAEKFTEEHRAAIDWLNRITDKEFNFFGIEVELIKIGDSPTAPIFNIIHWMNIAVGRSHFTICLLLNSKEQKVGVQLYIDDDADKKKFDFFYSQKEDAEKAIGQALEWERLDGKKASVINLFHKGDFLDKKMSESLCLWLRETTEKYIHYFKPLIKSI